MNSGRTPDARLKHCVKTNQDMKTPFAIIAVLNDTQQNFLGNTAAVVHLEERLSEKKMRALAADFNQPATTFLWPGKEESDFHVRWFAPDDEIGLCGHGSLAAIAYLSGKFGSLSNFELHYSSGKIGGHKKDETCFIEMEKIPVTSEQPVPDLLRRALGIPLKGYFITSNKHIVLAEGEGDIQKMKPDFALLRTSETFGYAVTAPGETVDFVSRTLVPHVQQLEDHATGSSHAALAPFWSERLNKEHLIAHQLSPRGGRFVVDVKQQRVVLGGNYKVIAEGRLSN